MLDKRISAIVIGVGLAINVLAQEKVECCYSYKYGDRESSLEAKQFCLAMAMRKAVESNSVFIRSSSTVKDFQLLEDYIASNSTALLRHLKIIDEVDKNNVITLCILAEFDTSQVKSALKEFSQDGLAKYTASNDCVRIVSGSVDSDNYMIKSLTFNYSLLKHIGEEEMNPVFFPASANCYTLFWTIFGSDGNPLCRDKRKILHSDVLPGEVRSQTVQIWYGCKDCTVSWGLWPQ